MSQNDQASQAASPVPLSLLIRLLRVDQPESAKRALALLAGATLCGCLVLLALTEWYEACLRPSIDGSLVTSLGLLAGSVAGLAGVAYRKQDSVSAAPGAAPAAAEPPASEGPQ